MTLRPKLCPVAPDASQVASVRALVRAIEDANGNTALVEPLLAELQAATGKQVPRDEVENFWRSTDLESFIQQLTRPIPQAVEDVTREELNEVIRRANPVNGFADYEGYMAIFDANVPMPKASAMLFDPPDALKDSIAVADYNPAPEQIVEWALAYRSIFL